MDEPGHKLLVSSEGAARQMEAALQMDARLHKLCTEASAAGDARLAEAKRQLALLTGALDRLKELVCMACPLSRPFCKDD